MRELKDVSTWAKQASSYQFIQNARYGGCRLDNVVSLYTKKQPKASGAPLAGGLKSPP